MKSTKEQVAKKQGRFRYGRVFVVWIFALKQLIEEYKKKKLIKCSVLLPLGEHQSVSAG